MHQDSYNDLCTEATIVTYYDAEKCKNGLNKKDRDTVRRSLNFPINVIEVLMEKAKAFILQITHDFSFN